MGSLLVKRPHHEPSAGLALPHATRGDKLRQFQFNSVAPATCLKRKQQMGALAVGFA
jgi:hypothetical protein